jgi:hypothetical protein
MVLGSLPCALLASMRLVGAVLLPFAGGLLLVSGILLTAYLWGNRSSNGILSGQVVSIQFSAVGKYTMEFSGWLLL